MYLEFGKRWEEKNEFSKEEVGGRGKNTEHSI